MAPQFLLPGQQFRVKARKQVGACLNPRRDKAEQFNVRISIFFYLFVGDLSFWKNSERGRVRHGTSSS
jgi:hypothetical protein